MNTVKISCFVICLLLGSYLTSCTMTPNALPYAQGDAGDVLVVMRDNLWRGACGDSVRQCFSEPARDISFLEPAFSLSHQVGLTRTFQRFRNILIVNIDQGFEYADLGYKTDMYARNQLIFNIDAPSADSAIACLYRSRQLITARFLLNDRDAIIEDYRRIEDKLVTEKLREKFQVDVIIPKPYKVGMEKDDFIWIDREEGERIRGILMWKEPYVRKTQLDTDSLIFKMNAITRKYVPGNIPGSYMADEPTVPPVVKRFEKEGVYSVQMNGLWQMENGFMGGPYVSQTIIDIQRGQLVTALGFVFFPNRDKRLMVRQLEAILYTMTPTEE